MITVTMPLNEYENMKMVIEQLKKHSVHNFIRKDYQNITLNEYEVTIDVLSIINYLEDKGYQPTSFITNK